jgi:CheY-like chemotaxis protein
VTAENSGSIFEDTPVDIPGWTRLAQNVQPAQSAGSGRSRSTFASERWPGVGLQMDQAHIESFLDDGWCLIGQLHQWMSRWPQVPSDRASLIDLINGLQSLWGTADDLGLTRLSRISLALEQVFERFCARNLEVTNARLADVTAGVGSLQELLLGLEATREQPDFTDLAVLQRLEHHALQPKWRARDESIVVLESAAPPASVAPPVEVSSTPIAKIPQQQLQHELSASPLWSAPPLLMMLEQFVVKLDDTCHQLHARMVADETPYVTTTSRLEHLAQMTRQLVDQIGQQVRSTGSPQADGSSAEQIEFPAAGKPPRLVDMSTAAVDLRPSTFDARPTPICRDETEAETGLSIADFAVGPRESELVHSGLRPQRVLMIEESLFYRHLIGLAVQSAGYEFHSADSVTRGLEVLDMSPDWSAILVGATVSAEIASVIQHLRQKNSVKVIGLTTSNYTGHDAAGDVDAMVSKSHPQELIAILNRLCQDRTGDTRKSA